MTNGFDWLTVVFVSEQTVLTFESYILFLNTVTGMSKLSTIKPGVRVRSPVRFACNYDIHKYMIFKSYIG